MALQNTLGEAMVFQFLVEMLWRVILFAVASISITVNTVVGQLAKATVIQTFCAKSGLPTGTVYLGGLRVSLSAVRREYHLRTS